MIEAPWPISEEVASCTWSDVWAITAPIPPPPLALAETYEVRSAVLVIVKLVVLMVSPVASIVVPGVPIKASVLGACITVACTWPTSRAPPLPLLIVAVTLLVELAPIETPPVPVATRLAADE